MKNRLLLLIVIAVCCSSCSNGQESNAAAENGKCLLWRISGKGLAKPSYLFGTIDFICGRDYLWTDAMEDCYHHCNTVCLKLDISDPGLKSKARTMLMNSGGKTLKDYFKPEEYESVALYAKDNLNVDLSMIQTFSPVAIQPLIIKKLLSCGSPASYDIRLADKAKKDGKQVSGLETLEDELNVLAETHFNEFVAKVLTEMAHGSDYYAQFRQNIENAYQRQDLPHMHTLFKETTTFSPADLDVFLNQTNKRWMAGMPVMMQQQPVFFALNAINLWGDEGMISLLKKAGYTVEPVTK
jgi:uncharacterized protein